MNKEGNKSIIESKKNSYEELVNVEGIIEKTIVGQRGFDVINQNFFVQEYVWDNSESLEEISYVRIKRFDTFDLYYDYLQGDIYENACYYQWNASKTEKELDKERLFRCSSFINYNIDDYKETPSEEEKTRYNKGEKTKKQIKKWVDKFVLCDSFEKLSKMVESYYISNLYMQHELDVEFFFWQYIFFDVNDRHRFEIIMQYMSTGRYPECKMIFPLCHIYNPDEIVKLYDYSLGNDRTCNKYKRKLKEYVDSMKDIVDDYKETTNVFFDNKTHYYCVCSGNGVHRYFETIDELMDYRNNDLTHTDLTEDIELKYDFSQCVIDETTKLPISYESKLKYVVKKKYIEDRFEVIQEWYNLNNVLIKKYTHSFEHFFDFVAFLKGDLSEADLLFCDGLKNLNDLSGLKFTNARTTSAVSDMLGIKYKKCNVDKGSVESFSATEKNEEYTKQTLQLIRESEEQHNISIKHVDCSMNRVRIDYISDIHIMHKLVDFKAKSKEDIIYIIQSIVNNIVDETRSILLIGGDVSSDYTMFKLFIELLRKELDKRQYGLRVIFVLGNHELWNFSEKTFEDIVKRYRKLIEKNKMYLIQNEIICVNSEGKVEYITATEIKSLNIEMIRERVRMARVIFFGGLAFSGYNEEFNANNGLYRTIIDREKEIEESKRFEELYRKVLKSLPDKKVIVFTHMPMDCWCKKEDYHRDYVYVSGHTHRNYFYDDGEVRIYSDNQIGYKNINPHIKSFEIDNSYDFFVDYSDGIHEITKENYKAFYRGKNIRLTFNREVYKIYMLKKSGYYCFIHESKTGSLTIMNGGELKKLYNPNIQYYYNNMDKIILKIKSPLDEYTQVQSEIAKEVKRIGGSGKIHGCIVDIDWYNHIYVNPIDMKITGYCALDIINKIVYPDIPNLLKVECPEMYIKYMQLLKDDSTNLPVLANKVSTKMDTGPKIYLETDIYNASREIKKMQRLHSNILVSWYDYNNNTKNVEKKNR